MIFLTVGTQFPFDRLVRAVDEAMDRNSIGEDIFAQIGTSSYTPKNFHSVANLAKKQFDECIQRASGVISHAGIGSITIALEKRKPLLVLPRLKRYGEVVNDHQLHIARKLEQLRYLLVAYREEEIPKLIENLKSFVPRKRQNKAKEISERIAEFLRELDGQDR